MFVRIRFRHIPDICLLGFGLRHIPDICLLGFGLRHIPDICLLGFGLDIYMTYVC